MNLLNLGVASVVILTGFGLVAGIGYLVLLQSAVRMWFGDEPGRRWNREARQRRRRFEKTCGYALFFMLLSIAMGTARLLISERSAELGRLLLFAQLGLIAVMLLVIWAAIAQWREPFEN